MKASRHLSANLWTAVVALACLALVPSAALGFATDSWSEYGQFSDLGTNPDDISAWDQADITYSFDASFDTHWPNPLVKDQVRLAFSEWEGAYDRFGTVYSYGRRTGRQEFGDIRTIALHEIGHALGMGHPNEAHTVGRNWQRGDPPTPIADQGNEVMGYGLNQPGSYNHVLGVDERQGYWYLYPDRGYVLNFTETTGTGDIVVSAYAAGEYNWGRGGASYARRGELGNQGARLSDGFVKFNMASLIPIGLKTLGMSWDCQNVGGQPTEIFAIRTTGTNNPDPLSHDDNNGPDQFNGFRTLPYATSWERLPYRDDLWHVWEDPASGNIPQAEVIHLGLEQDVWDWSVVEAMVVHPDGSMTAAPVLSVQDWNNTIVTGTPSAAGGPSGTSDMGPETEVLARGIRIVASDIATLVSDLRLAPVDDMGLGLDDLNSTTLGVLTKMQMVEVVEDFGQQTLAPGSDFIIVFEGTEDDLPLDVRDNGNFMILDQPEYLDQELFVSALSRALEGEGVVRTYALLGTGVIVPEPATLALLGLGAVGLVARRRRK